MEFNNIIEYHLSKTHHNNRFKSYKLDILDKNYESDTQTIVNFDDEFCEISNNINVYSIEKSRKHKSNEKEIDMNKKDNNKMYSCKKQKYRNNSFDENIVNNTVKNLIEIDTNDKEGIINILLQKDLVKKKIADQNEIIKEKNRNKFYYIESKTKPRISTKLQNTYGRKGYQIELDEGNPEFIKDMNYAKYKLKKKIIKENEEIASILFNGTEPIPNPHRLITRKEIGEKIQNALDKKRKNLEKIEWELYEKQKLEQTFSPAVKNKQSKRSFELFLQDQNNYLKKLKVKNQYLLKKNQSEEKGLFIGHPLINKNSEEIAKKLGIKENVYERLYKRYTYDNKKKENDVKLLEIKDKIRDTSNNSKSKKNKYSHIQSKINIWDKKNKSIKKDSNIKTMGKRAKSSFDIFNEQKVFSENDLASNKMLWNKFNKKFEKVIEIILLNKNKNGLDTNIITNDELDENQYYEVLYNLGMINNKQEKEYKKIKNKINQKHDHSYSEEVKLVRNSFKILNLGENKIKVSNLKEFLIFVLILHNYYFYHQYKLNHTSEELQKLFPLDKYKKEEIPYMMIKKYNEELLSMIDKTNNQNTKYFYISKNDNKKIIITLDNYNYIKKDFSLFSLNYNTYKIKSIPRSILELSDMKFYKKVYPELNDGFNSTSSKKYNTNKKQNRINNNNIEYINKLLLFDKRKKVKNEKIKEELANKDIKECTFKPKINSNYPVYIKPKKENYEKYKKFISNKSSDKNKNDRIEEMYEEGKKTVRLRKDRNKIDIEIEKQKKECTFRPNVYPNKKIKKNNYISDIYNEKQYISLYDRLKKGRLDKMVKDNCNDRYELNDELKKYVKDRKESNINIPNGQTNYNQISGYYNNNNNMYVKDNQNTQEKMTEKCNLNVDVNNNGKKSTNELDNEIDIESKNSGNSRKRKEPLLTIEVNITEGLKKMIYIFPGDTSKDLAQKFAEENKLDIETQNKLEKLIHEQMVKPLTKIEEENFSGSDKN